MCQYRSQYDGLRRPESVPGVDDGSRPASRSRWGDASVGSGFSSHGSGDVLFASRARGTTEPSSLLCDLRGLGACSRRSRRLARVSKTDEVPDTEDSRGDGLAAGDRVAAGDCVAARANASGASLEIVDAAPRLLHLLVKGWRAVPRTGDDPTPEDVLPAAGEGDAYARIAVYGGISSPTLPSFHEPTLQPV